MAAYKKLKREDSYLTTYVAHKTFTVSGSQHNDYGVETYIGISGSGEWLPSGSDNRLVGTDYEHSTRLVYNSIHHLYYSGYNELGLPTTSSNSMSGSAFENYLQSSYTANQRRAQNEFTVLSIPQNLFGTHIKPGSVRLSPPAINSGSNYVNIYESTENVYNKQPEDFNIILLATGSASTTDTVSIEYLSSSGYTGGNNGDAYYDNNNSSDGNTSISNIEGISTNDYDLYVFDNRNWGLDGSEIQLALNLFDAGKSVLITGNDTSAGNYTGSNGTEWPIMAGNSISSTTGWMAGPSAVGFGLPSDHPVASELSGNVGISTSSDTGKTITSLKKSPGGGTLVYPFTVNTNTTSMVQSTVNGSMRYTAGGTNSSITSWIATNSNGGRIAHLQMFGLDPLDGTTYDALTVQAATNLREFLLRNNSTIEDYYSFASSSYVDKINTLYGGTQTLQDGDYVDNEGNYINELESEFVVPGFDDYSTVLIDDTNGNLILSASQPQRIVGNVIYTHGLVIITNPVVGSYYSNYFSGSLTWQSSHPIYTYNYHCPIKENEFNFSLNPSAVKNGTTGSVADNITGSYFNPYFTTVGLYNDANELVAVGKMGQPVPVSDNNETTVVVKLDI